MRTHPFPHPCFLTHERSFFSLAVLLHSRDGKPIDSKVRSILLDSRKTVFASDLPLPSTPGHVHLRFWHTYCTPTVALTKVIRIFDGAYVHVGYAFPNLLLDLPSNHGQIPSPMGLFPIDLVRVGDVHWETMVEAIYVGASPLPSFHGRVF
jgi:hypothetical protein